MTKKELIEFLKPFDDDIKITVEIGGSDGSVNHWPVTCAHYYYYSNPEKEGEIILCL